MTYILRGYTATVWTLQLSWKIHLRVCYKHLWDFHIWLKLHYLDLASITWLASPQWLGTFWWVTSASITVSFGRHETSHSFNFGLVLLFGHWPVYIVKKTQRVRQFCFLAKTNYSGINSNMNIASPMSSRSLRKLKHNLGSCSFLLNNHAEYKVDCFRTSQYPTGVPSSPDLTLPTTLPVVGFTIVNISLSFPLLVNTKLLTQSQDSQA